MLIAGNGDAIYVRLMTCIGRDDLGRDPDLAHNDGRARRVAGSMAPSATGPARVPSTSAGRHAPTDVPSGRIYTVADIARDPHYRAREAITTVRAASGIAVDMPAVFPHLSDNPGAVRERAPTLGEHTDAVLASAGLSQEQRDALRARGVIE